MGTREELYDYILWLYKNEAIYEQLKEIKNNYSGYGLILKCNKLTKT